MPFARFLSGISYLAFPDRHLLFTVTTESKRNKSVGRYFDIVMGSSLKALFFTPGPDPRPSPYLSLITA
jgi:hypothetical protein